jgi:5'-nucleotidase
MRVLLTNDDGIYAKGIEALYQALIKHHEVTVVAPETEQSAVGHAITFLDPLKVKPVRRNGNEFGYALDGTPADCVKLGFRELVQPPPEVVVSGINMGANVGHNVLYSGTVSAATEGALLGLPAVAVSMDSFEIVDYSAATETVLKVLEQIQTHGLPRGVSLNINVPAVPPADVRGVRITHQGTLDREERFDRRIDPRNRTYYWLHSVRRTLDPDPDSDVHALAGNYISIMPIRYDLTHYRMVEQLKEWDFDGEPIRDTDPAATELLARKSGRR